MHVSVYADMLITMTTIRAASAVFSGFQHSKKKYLLEVRGLGYILDKTHH